MYNTLAEHTISFVLQICDLGSARRLDQTVRQTTAVGTYAWMAPEVRGCKHRQIVTDIILEDDLVKLLHSWIDSTLVKT